MRKLNISSTNKKVTRGASRKIRDMIETINGYTQVFPEEASSQGYRHLHMPISQSFIDSKNTSNSIKRLLIQMLVDRLHHLYRIRPDENKYAKVVLLLNMKDLRNSQIIVFFSKEYFDNFFDREGPEQIRQYLGDSNHTMKSWNIAIPNVFKVKTYKEKIIDEDFTYETELVFIGEL